MLMSHGYSCITGSQLCNNHQFLEMFQAELWGQMEAFLLMEVMIAERGFQS
jgi:hypothetical protein